MKKIRLGLVLLFLFSFIFDVFTYLIYQNNAFEVNILYRIFGSITFVILLKFAVVFFICVMYYYEKLINSNFLKYFITLGILLGTVLQILGGISNVTIEQELQEGKITAELNAPKTVDAIRLYKSFIYLYFIYPLFIGSVAFIFYDYGFRKGVY